MLKNLFIAAALTAAATTPLAASSKQAQKIIAKEIKAPKNLEEKLMLATAVQLAAIIGATADDPFDPEAYEPVNAVIKDYKGKHKLDKPFCDSPVKAHYLVGLAGKHQSSLIILASGTALFAIKDLSEAAPVGNTLSVTLPSFVADKEASTNHAVAVKVQNKTTAQKMPWMVRVGTAAKVPVKIASITPSADGTSTLYHVALSDGTAWTIDVEAKEYRVNTHIVNLYAGLKEWAPGDSILPVASGDKGGYLLYNLDRKNLVLNEAKRAKKG